VRFAYFAMRVFWNFKGDAASPWPELWNAVLSYQEHWTLLTSRDTAVFDAKS
jgi:hypothetical protein